MRVGTGLQRASHSTRTQRRAGDVRKSPTKSATDPKNSLVGRFYSRVCLAAALLVGSAMLGLVGSAEAQFTFVTKWRDHSNRL